MGITFSTFFPPFERKSEGEEIGLWEGKVVVLEGEDEETEVSGRTRVGSEDRRDDDARVLREADVDDDTNLLHIFALRFSGWENVLDRKSVV